MNTIEKIITIANARVGLTEYPPNSNNVDCNTWYYGHEVSGANYKWCCVEQQYIFNLAGASNLIKRTAKCEDLKNWYQSKNRIFNTPEVGDHVFLTFSSNRSIGHIGYVVKVYSDGSVDSYEGNTSSSNKGSQSNGGGCFVRHRTKKNIVCFGRPEYVDIQYDKPVRKTIKKGDAGIDVKDLQNKLRTLKFGCKASGYFDDLTEQCVIYYQTTHGLEVDGVVGPQTWTSLGM